MRTYTSGLYFNKRWVSAAKLQKFVEVPWLILEGNLTLSLMFRKKRDGFIFGQMGEAEIVSSSARMESARLLPMLSTFLLLSL